MIRTPLFVPPFGRMMVFIDGENLVSRFQEMKNSGGIPFLNTKHIPDVFVWNSNDIITRYHDLVIRTTYYTSSTGDDDRLREVRETISACRCQAMNGSAYAPPGLVQVHENIVPVVLKKNHRTRRSKGVDIRMTLDMLSHGYQSNFDSAFLISGDSDFIPVIEELMRRGRKVFVGALSSGLHPGLRNVADGFFNLDGLFFQGM
jgi:uncharacterized LabA/DUF88 family protein